MASYKQKISALYVALTTHQLTIAELLDVADMLRGQIEAERAIAEDALKHVRELRGMLYATEETLAKYKQQVLNYAYAGLRTPAEINPVIRNLLEQVSAQRKLLLIWKEQPQHRAELEAQVDAGLSAVSTVFPRPSRTMVRDIILAALYGNTENTDAGSADVAPAVPAPSSEESSYDS